MKKKTIFLVILFISAFLVIALLAILKNHAEYPTFAHLYYGQTLAESSEVTANPDQAEIIFMPSERITSFEKFDYKTLGEKTIKTIKPKNGPPLQVINQNVTRHDDERKQDSLRIVKRNGTYYWDSNGGTELVAHTTDKINLFNGAGKYTFFIALDGSGIIFIRHDEFPKRGFCPKLRDYASYKEIRVNKREIYRGYGGYYPPKPSNWCDKKYPQ